MTSNMNNYLKPILAIIIVNWNNSKDTLECLNSLENSNVSRCKFMVILVDNGSKDSIEKLIDLSSFSFPLIIHNNKVNEGFTGGNNRGIKIAIKHAVKYVFLLNNDTVIEKNCVCNLAELLDNNPNIGIVGPVIFYYDTPNIIWQIGARINFRLGFKRGLSNLPSSRIPSKPIELDCVTGAGLMIRTDIIKRIGLLDVEYFCYFEDTDWSTKVKRLGYKVVCLPQAKLWHKVSKSTPSMIHYYYFYRNRLYFYNKYSNKINFLLIQFIILFQGLFNIIKFLFKKKYSIVKGIILGIFDYYRNIRGKSDYFKG